MNRKVKDSYIAPKASCHRIKVISILDNFSVKGQLEDFEDKDLGETEDPYGN